MNLDAEFSQPISRRTALKQAIAIGCAATIPGIGISAESTSAAQQSVFDYLESLARPDGGYAWPDQETSHLSSTFAVIACYRVFTRVVPHVAARAEFVRTHHPTEWKKLEQEHREFDYQQIQALLWLGADVSSFRDRVLGWQAPVPYLAQYERHRYPVLRFQLAAVTCRQLLGIPKSDIPQEWTTYLRNRRRLNGSFNNTPAEDGSDGNILNTWWGLEALQILSENDPLRESTVKWLQSCQAPDGGFRWQPQPEYGKESDAAYTWAAIQSLKSSNTAPLDQAAAIQNLMSLRNADGGFGDRPGWASNAMATRYALESLAALGALDQLGLAPITTQVRARPIPDGLQVFTIQIEAHGNGSPAEAVHLARALKIHLWGAKNANRRWLETAQNIADRDQVPVKFFSANEEYGTWTHMSGFGTYSHMSDVIAPAGAQIGPALVSKESAPSWKEFRDQRIARLHSGDGRLIWQFGENEELVRTVLDDSVERGGYSAISTFHFGNPDFTNSEPFLNRYRGRLPFVALQDAHGPEPWWFGDMTTGFRTLFLATEPSWKGWLTALQNNWVAAVRRDAVTQFRTRMHSGSDEVAQFVSAREMDWRWWDNPQIVRPLVSIVVIRPNDEFEAMRPDAGIAIRVRCAWSNTAQGQPKAPLAELKSMSVDGKSAQPELIEKPGPRGVRLSDHAHVVRMPDISTGEHRVEVTVKSLEEGREYRSELRFGAR